MDASHEGTVVPGVYFPPLFPFGFTPCFNGNRKMHEEGRKVIKTATMSKKTLEKLRRERMNMCIRRLKDLICEHTSEKERIHRAKTNQLWAFQHKWEKADVIELGVELLEETLNRLTKNDENVESKEVKSSPSHSPCPISPPQSLPSLPPPRPTPLFQRSNQSEIWRPF